MTRALLIQNHNRARRYKMSIVHLFFFPGLRPVYSRTYNNIEIVA